MPTPILSEKSDGILDDTVDIVSSTVESTDTLLNNAKGINNNLRIQFEKQAWAKIHPCF
jgi:hypothetical protein